MENLKLRMYTKEKGKVLGVDSNSKSVTRISRERPVSAILPKKVEVKMSPSPIKSGGVRKLNLNVNVNLNGNK
jgi:hypothetical protein